MNKGLTKALTDAFPNIIPENRPKIEITEIKDPYWIAGFSCGESCFDVQDIKNIKYKLGYQVKIRFKISQHERDRLLWGLISKYLKCGTLQISRHTVVLTIVNLEDIINIIIPFFDKYHLKGIKQLDYACFRQVAFLMEKKAHLTAEGLEQIREIKAEMNQGRNHDES
jgi:LAGLIDADG endonuclease